MSQESQISHPPERALARISATEGLRVLRIARTMLVGYFNDLPLSGEQRRMSFEAFRNALRMKRPATEPSFRRRR
jgi:hypothetical protein